MTKYGNKPVKCQYGYTHRSQLEGAVCALLRLREMAGELEMLAHEDHVYLTEARVHYIPDFKCRDLKTGEEIWIEAKGKEMARWPTIKRLWKHYGPGRLEIWKGSYAKPRLDKIIVPVGVEEK